MTPKEKAEELLNKCKFSLYNNLPSFHSETFKNSMIKTSKECALITVDEIIKYQDSLIGMLDTNDGTNPIFWEDVKRELENL